MRVTAKKNDGVSPVIGTILLVAITVVLVAIISAVVMGMAGDVGNAHVVGVKVVQGTDAASDNKSLLVTITGGDTTGLQRIGVMNGSYSMVNSMPFMGVGVPMNITGMTSDEDGDDTRLGAGLTYISVIALYDDGIHQLYSGTINLV
ncbi:MAG TPA: type IV pilin N-terminal domain-containing protein [Methanocorpusculum sp.]|nr:type IV pilin N-terminal domain-containing protein [Methanocorpusculum sp.]